MSPLTELIGGAKVYGWGKLEIPVNGAFVSLATVNVTGPTGNIEFNSIPQSYKHLQIRAMWKTSRDADSQMYFRANGDTTNNYYNMALSGNGSTQSAGGQGVLNVLAFGNVGPTEENFFTPMIMDIPNYTNTDAFKTFFIRTGILSSSTGFSQIWSGVWQSTAALSSITLFGANAAQCQANSKFALYGLENA
jgi:hypothetical protein